MLKPFLLATALIFASMPADAAQLKLLVGGAMQEPFREVGADFAKQTGHKLDFTVDAIEKEHLVVPGSRVELANAAIGVSVLAGAPSPDLSSPEAFKKAMLAAR